MKYFILEGKEIVLLHNLLSNHLFNFSSTSNEYLILNQVVIRFEVYIKIKKKSISIEGVATPLLYNLVYQELHNTNTIFNIDLLTKLENRFNKFIFITID